MDELLSDREQVERLRVFWRDNGWYIIGGVVVGVALLVGWNRYQAYKERQALAAAALYTQLEDAAKAEGGQGDADVDRLLGELRASYPSSPYTDQAAMLVAREKLVTNPDQAIAELRRVVDDTHDPELGFVARLRLARVLAYRQQYKEALDALAVDEPETFAARYSEVEGDIQVALENYAAARAAYQRALTAPPGQSLVNRSYVQMKLDDLPPVEINGAPAPEATSNGPTPTNDAVSAGESAPASSAAPPEAGASPDNGASPADAVSTPESAPTGEAAPPNGTTPPSEGGS